MLAFLYAALLGWAATRHSPIWNEPGHLVAGISHWQFGTFDLFRVNPPLVRMVASTATVLTMPFRNWRGYEDGVGRRPERTARATLVAAYGKRVFWVVTLARWACIPFSVVGAYVCFRWAAELYGQKAGILAMGLWCFSPNVLAHGQLITPDAGAAALGVAAAYLFWRWLKGPSWAGAVGAGLVLGLAELTKTTWIVLFGLWPLLWMVWRGTGKQNAECRMQNKGKGNAECRMKNAEVACGRQAFQMAVILVVGLYVLNLGYGFEGTFQRLGDYGFVSEALGGAKEDVRPSTEGQNRFAGTWLGRLPVPLPKNYLMGIDIQKSDFEGKMWSYLRGEWRMGGWWYYYLYGLGVKVPLGTWVLVVLAVGVTVFGATRKGTVPFSLRENRDSPRPDENRDSPQPASWRDELVLLAPLLVVLTLVSSQTGFNRHLRYVLPIFPFAFIWTSKVARAFQLGHWKTAAVVVLALCWSVGSSLWVYPHSLSYFNELAGGPSGGYAHLGCVETDSNLDWGQDLLYLKRWLDKHPQARPLGLAFNGSYDAGIAGIEYTRPPAESRPGWYALSVTKLHSRTKEYEYFLRFEPVAMAGYSIYIYQITLDEANRVRRELGLPELAASDGKKEG